MVIQLSTKKYIRLAVFVAVFLAVMSISFMLQAHDAPDGVQPLMAASAPVVSETVPAVPLAFDMADAPDGLASWYGQQFHGRRTASGTRFDMNEYTAAHRTLPFGTILRVENVKTGKSILVEVTDRGPFVRRRVIDLSYCAARDLGVSVSPVEIDALTKASISDFYTENDSTFLVFSPDLQPIVMSASLLDTLASATTLTNVMKSRSDSEYVIVRKGAKGNTTFTRACLVTSY
ncbi:MAG: septal ring lytic transglycosylase RlpA family protein [Candidatus Kapabacteria bacterium]|nr:septal ring lytic transglycosylase RlpA family protein [Candidatus Kapabacteria bacterium]